MAADRTNEQWLSELTNLHDSQIRDQAIEDLRERLQRGVYYYLSRERSDLSGRSHEDIMQMAQDFAQDAVLRVLNNIETFRGDSKFTTWATKIAARVAVSELRRARYRDFSLEDISADGEIMVRLSEVAASTTPTSSVAPERATERDDILQIIVQGFDEVLTDRQRMALQAVTLQGVPMDTVAELLDTNRNALYKLLHDARKKLKAYMEQQGLPMDYVMNLFSE